MKILRMRFASSGGQVQLWQAHAVPIFKINPTGDGVGQRAHLLVDFFVP